MGLISAFLEKETEGRSKNAKMVSNLYYLQLIFTNLIFFCFLSSLNAQIFKFENDDLNFFDNIVYRKL